MFSYLYKKFQENKYRVKLNNNGYNVPPGYKKSKKIVKELKQISRDISCEIIKAKAERVNIDPEVRNFLRYNGYSSDFWDRSH